MPFLHQFRAVPNLLTLLRLFIIPFLVIAILDGRYHLAFALFVLPGFSDGFDGLLAPLSAAQYAWIVLQRVNAPPPQPQ